jgi:hypothetical protein
MEDLRSLRATCKDMRQACKAKEVRRCIPQGLVLARASFDDKVTDFHLFRDTLVNKLAEVGHPEGCFRYGMRDIFGVNRGLLQSCLEVLKTAADAGHTLAAYMRALCLYRRNSGTGDDAEAMRLIREVEDNEDAAAPAAGGGGPTPWMNRGCVRCRLDTLPALAKEDVPRPNDQNGWPVRVAKPVVRVGVRCAGGNCGDATAGWLRWEKCSVFCSEECRLNNECQCFFNRYFW